jgi:glycosyltransferase involved in cell wall biosynthesis
LSQIDTTDDLATCLRQVLNDPAALKTHGLAARETVLKRYSMEAMADCYRELYRSTI